MYTNAVSNGLSNFILLAIFLLYRKIVHNEGIKDILIHFDKRGLKLFLEGFVLGIVGILLYTIIVSVFEGGTFYIEMNILKESLQMVLAYVIGFLAVALFEESLIRGFLLQKLKIRFGMVKSIVISSAIFGGLHFLSYASIPYFWLGILNASIIGVMLSVIVIRTNSLMLAIGFHLTWNLTQRLILLNNFTENNLSVNFKMKESLISGTHFVPEAGLAVSIVLFVIGIYIFARFRQNAMGLYINKGALNE